MTTTELHRRMCAFRVYHQAKRQDTATAEYLKRSEEMAERERRKVKARGGTVELTDWR